jgi:agmatinase
MDADPRVDGTFGAMTSGVVSMLKAPYVPSDGVAACSARVAFLGFPFDGANAAIERPGSANGPLGLRIASTFSFPWSFEWDIDLEEAYGLVDCGDCPIAVGNAVRTHRFVEREILNILEGGAIPITIGGHHSLSIPGARALSGFLGEGKRMGYLQIEAHLDAGVTVGGRGRDELLRSRPGDRAAERQRRERGHRGRSRYVEPQGVVRLRTGAWDRLLPDA